MNSICQIAIHRPYSCDVFKMAKHGMQWLGEERVACWIMLGQRSRRQSRLNQRCSLRWGFGRGGATPASKVSQLLLCVILSRSEQCWIYLSPPSNTKLWYSESRLCKISHKSDKCNKVAARGPVPAVQRRLGLLFNRRTSKEAFSSFVIEVRSRQNLQVSNFQSKPSLLASSARLWNKRKRSK